MIDWIAEGNAATAEWQQASPDKTEAERQAYHEAHLAAFVRRCKEIAKMFREDRTE